MGSIALAIGGLDRARPIEPVKAAPANIRVSGYYR
jgi:hypothetical protein